MKPHRLTLTNSLVMNYGMYKKMKMYIPAPATPKDMCRFHSLDYIDFLQKVTPNNVDEYSKFFQQYNVMEDWWVARLCFVFIILDQNLNWYYFEIHRQKSRNVFIFYFCVD